MSKFIHKMIRVNSSVDQAYKMFTVKDKIELWLCDIVDVNNDKFEFEIKYNDFLVNTSGSKIIKKNKNMKVSINLIDSQRKVDSIVEINFMRCISIARYCTEVHLVHKNISGEEFDFYSLFWDKSLDSLRHYYNKEWVIDNSELTLMKLTGKSL